MNPDRWELVQTRKGWHIRFRAANAEPVVHGEPLTSEAAAIGAMVAVAEAHSPVHRADYDPDRGVMRVYLNHGDWHATVPVVRRDERVLRRPPNPLAERLRRGRR